MYRIAMMPLTEKGKITLFATTEEWLRFVDHLRATQRTAIATMIMNQITPTHPTNRVTMTDVHARQVLRIAGMTA